GRSGQSNAHARQRNRGVAERRARTVARTRSRGPAAVVRSRRFGPLAHRTRAPLPGRRRHRAGRGRRRPPERRRHDARRNASMIRVPVDVPGRAYEAIVGTDIIASAGSLIPALPGAEKAFVVSDSVVSDLWLEPLSASLSEHGLVA